MFKPVHSQSLRNVGFFVMMSLFPLFRYALTFYLPIGKNHDEAFNPHTISIQYYTHRKC